MKTKEELNALKEEVEALNKKLHELTEEELAQVSGGAKFILNEGPENKAVATVSGVELGVKLSEGAVVEHLKAAEKQYELSKKSAVFIEELLQ